jgi:hypothetical protein
MRPDNGFDPADDVRSGVMHEGIGGNVHPIAFSLSKV